MNIAVFNASWPFKIYARDFMVSLAEKGHTVHLFAWETDFAQTRMPPASQNQRLRAHTVSFTAEQRARVQADAMASLAAMGAEKAPPNSREYGLAYWQSAFPLLADMAHAAAPDLDLGVGMDKGGLLWAEAWRKKSGRPYLYYSLELYAADSGIVAAYGSMAAMLALEGAAHASAAGTIVQDAARAEYLFHYNNVPMRDVFYFPVSLPPLPPVPQPEKSVLGKKVLLCFGMIEGRMSGQDVLGLYRTLPDDYVLCFHMPGAQTMPEGLKERFGLPRMRLSRADLDDAGIAALASRARVGLCWYSPLDRNNALTAFSSEKLALYLRHGIPVIVSAHSNFGALFAGFRCGEALCHVAELPQALAKIEAEYDAYRAAAFAAYERYYNHGLNFERVYAQLVQAGIITDTP